MTKLEIIDFKNKIKDIEDHVEVLKSMLDSYLDSELWLPASKILVELAIAEERIELYKEFTE